MIDNREPVNKSFPVLTDNIELVGNLIKLLSIVVEVAFKLIRIHMLHVPINLVYLE